MDEDQGQGSPGVNGEQDDRSPEQLRAEIEQTRTELGETVEALAAKTDVKAQARHAVDGAKTTVSDAASSIKETASGKIGTITSAAQEAAPESSAEAGRKLSGFARENRTVLIGLAALAVGVLIGSRRAR